MKAITLSVMMSLSGAFAFAADYYVSASGQDTNAGTQDAPFATINKAVSVAIAEDVIYVSGKITLSEQVSIEDFGGITFKGLNNAIVDGAKKTRLFFIRGVNDIVFEDLTMQNGYTESNDDTDGRGAALNIGSASVILRNCKVLNNSNECLITGNNQGGAVFADDAVFTATNSIFDGNESFQGGFLFANKSTINMTKCEVTSNQALDASLDTHSDDGRGGAFMASNCQLTFKNVKFDFNLAQGMGGVGFIGGSEVDQIYLFDGCSITNNDAGSYGEYASHAGAFFFANGKMNLTMVNTTIANNSCTAAGGIMMVDPANSGSEFTFINVTASNNQTQDNMGNCGGLRFLGDNHKVFIYNSIFEGNYSIANSAYADISFIGVPKNLVVENSIIGNVVNNGTTLTDGLSGVKNSTVNTLPAEPFVAGLDEALDDEFGIWRLTDGALGINYGDAKFLKNLDISVDQLGKVRPFENNKCYAGATEYLVGDEVITGMSKIEISELSVYPSPVTELLTLTASVNGNILVEVYDLAGRKIEVLANEVSDGQFRRTFNVAGYQNGIYFIAVNGKTIKFIKK